MALGACNPNMVHERPVGALGSEYNVVNHVDRTSAAGGTYERGFGSSAAPISEGINSIRQGNGGGNYYSRGVGASQGGLGCPYATGGNHSGGTMPLGKSVGGYG